MREHEAEFSRLKVKVVIVTFENDFFARQYAAESGLSFPLLIDETREAYRHYHMLDASFFDLWNFKSLWAYQKELLKGQKLQRPTNDIHQRGGNVLIDPDGMVRLHHVGNGPADRPPVELLLRKIAAAETKGNQ